MDLQAFIRLLDGVHGPSASGEYTARCPAHDDRTASLCVNAGDKGIILKCQAGCATDRVVAAMGLTMRDLFFDSALPSTSKRGKGSGKPPLGELEKVYPYTDENGKTLFEVVRFKNPKDFRQRVPDQSEKGGYRWHLKGVRTVIYRLPEVMKAIRDNVTVYICEGEKDCDTMNRLGLIATSSPMGAGKWRSEHSELLKGADICIIPDNDDSGREHANIVVRSLIPHAKSIRVLNLKEICEQLPVKGDATDFFQLMGEQEGLSALRILIDKTEPVERNPEDEQEAVAEAFSRVGGYCVEDGCICTRTDDGARKLCTFTAVPVQIITRDDGVTLDKVFAIDGWAKNGRKLPRIQVNATKFKGMTWPLDNWDFDANIMPGNSVAEKLRYVIAEVGKANARRETVYTHTGWRQIDGKTPGSASCSTLRI